MDENNLSFLSHVFFEFCESSTHLDSMLSKMNPNVKSKLAILFGAFLRRPLTLAKHLGIDLELTPEEFWQLSFIRLKKNTKVRDLLDELWKYGRRYDELPNQGSIIDFPSEMVTAWQTEWGNEAAEGFARFLSQDPLTTIRLNRRGLAREAELKAAFESMGLPKMREGHYSPVARIFKGYARVQTNDFFKQGDYEIQDEGSQVMSAFAFSPLEVSRSLGDSPLIKRGEKNSIQLPYAPITVVDACAGAGGKTLALADFMGGQGRVFAYDIFEKKISALKKRAERARERNIQATVLHTEMADAFLERYRETVDSVLIDAPCTGLGVLRRNPDIKWNRKPLTKVQTASKASIEIESLQRAILKRYSPMVKKGGRLVYGVCTFTRSETLDQVKWIEENLPEFKLETKGFIGPHETDGFFMASFQRF